jgi:predicted transcriptional regulator
MSRKGVRDIPPPLELECLSVLWRLGESNVRTVQEALAASRPLAYTTVMTMLERLARKQLVSRHKAGRHFLYTAQVDRDAVRQNAIKNLVDSLFDASPAQLTAFLAADAAGPAQQLTVAAAAGNVGTESAPPAGNDPGAEDDPDNDIDAVLL